MVQIYRERSAFDVILIYLNKQNDPFPSTAVGLFREKDQHCGIDSSVAFKLRHLIEHTTNIIEVNSVFGHIPDDTFELNEDTIYVRPKPEFNEMYDRPALSTEIDQAIDRIRLKPQTFENARSFAAGWDLYGHLEIDWRRMLKERQTVPKEPDGSFIGFVKWYVKKNGKAR